MTLRSLHPKGRLSRKNHIWLEFLTLAQLQESNYQALGEYFLSQFITAPESFYKFLSFLGKFLKTTKDAKGKKNVAMMYLHVLSSLCERFGFFEEKNAMDNQCFRIVDPVHYRSVSQLLARYKRKSAKTIHAIRAVLTDLLHSSGYDHEIQGRYKNLYSIYRKVRKKRYTSPLTLHDIFAFRIILKRNDVEECFAVLNLLHDRFHPLPGSFKDYISIPKTNGYQSVHTILRRVLVDLELPIEVQIRTQAMHQFAERGIASHWIYSRSKVTRFMTEKERKLVAHFLSLSEGADRKETVYCLSPKGDVMKIERGATALDFAYEIHTEVGNRACAALVNNEPQDLSYVIQEGDIVHIMKSAKRQVSKEWLRIAFNPSTRKKIYDSLRS